MRHIDAIGVAVEPKKRETERSAAHRNATPLRQQDAKGSPLVLVNGWLSYSTDAKRFIG
jgi:hypothetical protein